GAIGAEDLPEEGPEGQEGGLDDELPSGAFFREDLLDGELGEDAVEAQLGLGCGLLLQPEHLEAEPGRGTVSHGRPPCGWWGPEHPHHPTSEVFFHALGGCAGDGGDN